MAKLNPKRVMDKAETVLNAFEQIAPGATLGGVKLADYLAQVERSREKRSRINDLEDQKTLALTDRDNTDHGTLEMTDLVVNGVIGDPSFGPDSALYEAMGFIRKSARKSGLTRKKKPAATP